MAAVTVIVTTYARPLYLRQAIASVLAQSFQDFVVAIGDNEGSASTRELVESFGDPRLHYCHRERNLGAQGNWLDLVRAAQTPLVATLHDDDLWKPDFLGRLVPAMHADPSLAMAFADFEVIDCEGEVCADETRRMSAQTRRDRLPAGTIRPSLSDGLRLVAVWNAPNPAVASVVRRAPLLALPYPAQAEPLYDLWISYQLAKAGAHFHYVNDRLVQYRSHGMSSTAAGWSEPEDYIFGRILAENPQAGPVLDEIRRHWASIRWGRARRWMADPALHAASRHELAQAGPHLDRIRRALAGAALGSDLVWSLLCRARGQR